MQVFQQDSGQGQYHLIAAYNQYAERHPDIQALDSNGVCAALAIAFCHSRLLGAPHDRELWNFDCFLKNFQSQETIELFFNTLESLTQQYQHANGEYKKSLLRTLEPFWGQLAILNFALSMYAKQDEPYSIGLYSAPTAVILGHVGLTSIGGSSFLIPPSLLEEILFTKNISDSPSILSPLAPGGTYLIQVPQHMCAVHVSEGGQITYYDPNAKSYLSTKEDIQKYIKEFEPFNSFNQIPIKIIAVRLRKQELENDFVQRSLSQIKQSLSESCQYNLTQHKNIVSEPYKAAQIGLIQNICEIGTPEARQIFKEIMLRAEPSDFEMIMSQIFQSYGIENSFPFVDILLENEKFFSWSFDNEMFLKKILLYQNPWLFEYVLQRLPENHSYSDDFREFMFAELKKYVNLGQQDIVQKIITTIFNKGFLKPNISDTFKLFIDNALDTHSLAEIAIKAWQKITQDQPLVFSQNYGLAFYLLETDFNQKTIEEVIASESYIWHPTDIFGILSSPHTSLKNILENKSREGLLNIYSVSPLVFAASYGRPAEIANILKSDCATNNELLDCLVYAASNGHAKICAMLMAYHSVMPRQKLFEIALLLAAENGHQKTLELLFDFVPKDLLQKKIDAVFERVILAGAIPILLWLKKKYKLRPKLAKELFIKHSFYAIQKGHEEALRAFIVAGVKHIALDVSIEKFQAPAIVAATLWNKKNIVELLLKAGANPNVHREFEQPLSIAVKFNKNIVQLLLMYGANINYCNQYNQTALMHAVAANREDIVGLLIEQQAHISVADQNQETALHIAIAYGFNNIALKLIAAKADFEIEDSQGYRPLVLAAKRKSKKIFLSLLDAGAEITDLKKITEILKHQGDTQEQVSSWLTAIVEIALERGRSDILEAFKNSNVMINSNSFDCGTVLMTAVYRGEYLLLRLFLPLLEPNPNLNLVYDNVGDTLLTVAVDRDDLQTVLTLLQAGADIDIPNNVGQTPLYRAVSNGNIKIVKALLSKGANLNIADINGIDPCMLALETQQLSIASELLKAGAPIISIEELSELFMIAGVNKKEREQFCQHIADIGLEYGHEHLLEFFINAGINFDFNPANKALQIAIFNNHVDVVMLYIKNIHNKDVLLKNKDYLIALASESRHQGIAAVLKEKIQHLEAEITSSQTSEGMELDETLLQLTITRYPVITSQEPANPNIHYSKIKKRFL